MTNLSPEDEVIRIRAELAQHQEQSERWLKHLESVVADRDRLRARLEEHEFRWTKMREEIEGLQEGVTITDRRDPEWQSEVARLRRIEEAARALSELVEMDESGGVCLSSRVEALALRQALTTYEETR